ncbi:MAG: hypothetical protein U0805_01145 [Pirellulales bacterium]
MDQERNLGVTEARFGLTLVICMLAAIGFFVLLRLGNTSEPTMVEIRPAASQQDPEQAPQVPDDQPQVLPVQSEPRYARRSELLQTNYNDAPSATPADSGQTQPRTELRR